MSTGGNPFGPIELPVFGAGENSVPFGSGGPGLLAGFNPAGFLIGMGLNVGIGLLSRRMAKKQSRATPQRTLDMQTSTARIGAPRPFCIGGAVRVPLHVLYQSDRVRERLSNGGKGGAQAVQNVREVFTDLVLGISDNPLAAVLQLLGDGKIVYWTDRNLVKVATTRMSATVDSGKLKIQTFSVDDPDFSLVFKVNDRIKLLGWSPGTQNGYWRAETVSAHLTNNPSYIRLEPFDGQTPTASTAAGSVFSPAIVERVDDGAMDYRWTVVYTAAFQTLDITWDTTASPPHDALSRVFGVGDLVNLNGFGTTGGLVPNGQWVIGRIIANGNLVTATLTPGPAPNGLTLPGTNVNPVGVGTSTNPARVFFNQTQRFVPGKFASEPEFRPGDDAQTELSVLAQHFNTGHIPAFRGHAVLGIDEFSQIDFGNRLPVLEAIVKSQNGQSIAEAINVIAAWLGFPTDRLDLSGVTPRILEGYYFQGPQSLINAIAPLVVKEQLVTQERDGVLHFFSIPNAEEFQLDNLPDSGGGIAFSEMNCFLWGDQPPASYDALIGEVDDDELFSGTQVTFQDPDRNFGDGSIRQGVRHPSAYKHAADSLVLKPTITRNENTLSLGQLVLRRQEARNIAATVMRRARINARKHEASLWARRIPDVLENDIVKYVDSFGNPHQFRALGYELDLENFMIKVNGVRETTTGNVHGSHVLPNTGSPPLPGFNPGLSHPEILDVVPIKDEWAVDPTLIFVGASKNSSPWGGLRVFESRDGGTSYDLVGFLERQSCMGYALTALADGTPSDLPGQVGVPRDDVSTVDVQFDNLGVLEGIGLSGATTAAVLTGRKNWFLVGNEIIGAERVTPMAQDRGWTLDRMYRGLRRTQTTGHAVNERVVMLTFIETAALVKTFQGASQVGQALKYKILVPGQALSEATAIDLTLVGRSATPFAPWGIAVTRDGSNNATITWRRDSRLNVPLGGSVGGFDEDVERYRLEFYATSAFAGPIAHTINRLPTVGSQRIRDLRATFTAAEQTTAGLTAGATLHYRVFQVGRNGDSPAAQGNA